MGLWNMDCVLLLLDYENCSLTSKITLMHLKITLLSFMLRNANDNLSYTLSQTLS